MTKVNMNTEQFKITQADPELPKELMDARRNHGGMTVPDGFFAQFEQKMNAVIDADIQVKSATETVATESGKVVSMRNRWAGIAAAAVVLFAISMAFQFDWLGDKLTSDQDAIAANPEMEDEYDPAEDVFYASLSDYEVYDLICGI